MFSYKAELRDKNMRRIEAEYFRISRSAGDRLDAYFYVRRNNGTLNLPVYEEILVAFVADPLTVRLDDHPQDTTSDARTYLRERPGLDTTHVGP